LDWYLRCLFKTVKVLSKLLISFEEKNLPSVPFVRPTDDGPSSVLTNTTEIDVWSTSGLTTPTGNGNFS
jgi:hypothetical protein